MIQHNFKPDYAIWWDKPDLKEEELAILSFGISPDQWQKFQQLSPKMGRTREEERYVDAFAAHVANGIYKDCWTLESRYDELLARKFWGNGKLDFVNNIHKFGTTNTLSSSVGEYLDAHPDFFAFLETRGEKPTEYDHYKKSSTFKLDVEKWEHRSITNEDDAIAIVLGFEPEHFLRCMTLNDREGNTLKSGEEWIFWRHYALFIRSYHHTLGMFTATVSELAEHYHNIKKKGLWKDDLNAFAHALVNDAGYILRPEVRVFLENRGADLSYDDHSQTSIFYKKWLRERLWTLYQALLLFKGIDPKNDRRVFLDISQCHGYLSDPSKTGCYYYDPLSKHAEDINKLAMKHIADGYLPSTEFNGEPHFKPHEIVKWLLEQTSYKPPEPLLIALGMKPQAPKLPTTASAVTKAIIWMKGEIESGKNHGKRDDWHKAVSVHVSGLSYRQFTQTVWAQTATNDMKRGGRRKRNG